MTSTILDLHRPMDADPGMPPPADDLPLSAAEQAQVDQALRTIRALLLTKRLELAASLHRYVLDEFFDGSWENYSQRGKFKSRAFEALTQSAELGVGRETLHEWLRVGEQLRQLPGALAQQLSVEHHRALLRVADSSDKARLAQEALQAQWSAKELAGHVRQQLPPRPRPGAGRPVQARLFQRLAATATAARKLDRERLAAEASHWTEHQRKQAKERAQLLRELADALLAVVGE